MAQVAAAPQAAPRPRAGWTFTSLARAGLGRAADAVAFGGESLVAAALLPRRRREFRKADLLRVMDEAGGRAVPLVLLLGFLMGLILAFQSSVPLRRFGADIFVVNLVALSLLRELGPLLAAVILAGRTGSAFAAELGTMKVNEELAALEVMGVSRMTMLVLPRLLAAVVVMPVLTLFLEAAGLLGMLAVMMAFGFPPAAVLAQLTRAVHARDLWSGLFKAVCFGAAVAGHRLPRGARHRHRAARGGPGGHGGGGRPASSPTIVLDGAFAILFFRLGT